MSAKQPLPGKTFASEPIDPVLETFYRPQRAPGAERLPAADRPKPTHYKVVCISLYTEDIARLERLVAELKKRGHTRANRSQVIRAALDQVDLDRIAKRH